MPVREIEKYCPYRQCIVPRGLGDSGARFCRDLISNTSKSPPISFLALFELCEALSYPGTCFNAPLTSLAESAKALFPSDPFVTMPELLP